MARVPFQPPHPPPGTQRLEVPIDVVVNVHVPEGNVFAMTNRAFQRMASAAARHLRDGHNATEPDPAHRITDYTQTDVHLVEPEAPTAPNVLGNPKRKVVL